MSPGRELRELPLEEFLPQQRASASVDIVRLCDEVEAEEGRPFVHKDFVVSGSSGPAFSLPGQLFIDARRNQWLENFLLLLISTCRSCSRSSSSSRLVSSLTML
jgi:hypothetical protein